MFNMEDKVSWHCSFWEDKEAYKSSFEQLISILDIHGRGILLEDENREILLTNKTFNRLFNIPGPTCLPGKNIKEIPQLNDNAYNDPAEFIKTTNRRLQSKEPFLSDVLFRKDGLVLEREYYPVITGGITKGCYWLFSDITKKSASEALLTDNSELFKHIFNYTAVSVCIVNTEGKFLKIKFS